MTPSSQSDPRAARKRHIVVAGLRCAGWGAMLSLAYPNALSVQSAWPGASWLCCLLLLPLLWELWREPRLSWRRALCCGYGFGLGFFILNVGWLSTVSWLAALLLAAYLALYPAMFACYAATWARPNFSCNLAVARGACRWTIAVRILVRALTHGFVWGGLELLRAHVLTGFGWNGLAVALPLSSPLVQAADLLGVAGVSAFLVAWQSVLMQIYLIERQHQSNGSVSLSAMLERFSHVGPWLAMALIPVTLLVYGGVRLHLLAQRETFELRALLLQLNVPQQAGQQLWSSEEIHLGYEEEAERAFADASAEPHWLLLPEVALNGRLLTAEDGTQGLWRESEETLERLLVRGHSDVFVGMVELEALKTPQGLRQADNARAWNSLVHVQPDFSLQTARKRHLVMFGEYIPLLDSLPWLQRLYEQQAGAAYGGAFSAGTSIEPLPTRVDGHDVSVIPSICFEDTVAAETRLFCRKEAQVIVNLTNDGWFCTSAAAAQHFANAGFRAIELRRPMLRCANTGVSASISILGNTQALRDSSGSCFTRGHRQVQLPVPLTAPWTLYAQLGDLPLLVLALLSLCHGKWSRNAT